MYKNSLIAMKDILCLKKVYTISIHSSRLQTVIDWRVKKVQAIDIRTTVKTKNTSTSWTVATPMWRVGAFEWCTIRFWFLINLSATRGSFLPLKSIFGKETHNLLNLGKSNALHFFFDQDRTVYRCELLFNAVWISYNSYDGMHNNKQTWEAT